LFFYPRERILAKRFVSTRCNVPQRAGGNTKAIMEWANEECAESLTKVQAPIISINSDEIPTNIEAFKKYHPAFNVKIVQMLDTMSLGRS